MSLPQTIYETLRFSPAALSFMFILLPVFLAVYYVVPVKARPAVLFFESLFFYYLAAPGYWPLMIACVGTDYALLRIMERWDDRVWIRRVCLGVSVLKSVLLIIYFGTFGRVDGALPVVGLQIYALLGMGTVIDAYRRKLAYPRGIFCFGLYCCFFPRLYAGPLGSFEDFANQAAHARLKIRAVLMGMGRFVEGAFKTAVLGSNLYVLHQALRGVETATVLSSWCVVFTAALTLYYAMSGLCEMARGIGEMFAIKLPQNFYYPYQSRSVGDFFDRFNITAVGFFRDKARIELNRRSNAALTDTLNIFFVGAFTGLWMGLHFNNLIWGLYLAGFVWMEKYAYPKLLARAPTFFSRIGTFCVVLLSFAVLVGESLDGSVRQLRSMVDFSSIYNEQVLYHLSSNWLLLLIGCIFATNIVSLAVTKLRRAAPAAAAALTGAIDAVLLILLIALTI